MTKEEALKLAKNGIIAEGYENDKDIIMTVADKNVQTITEDSAKLRRDELIIQRMKTLRRYKQLAKQRKDLEAEIEELERLIDEEIDEIEEEDIECSEK